MVTKVYGWITDFFEVYLSIVLFFLLFIVFTIQVLSRFIFHLPLMWTDEISRYSYVWVVFLGTSYMERDQGNIKFPIVYESASQTIKWFFDILHQSALVAFFIFFAVPTYKYFIFAAGVLSSSLKIPLGIANFGFVIWCILYSFRSLCRLIPLIRFPIINSNNQTTRRQGKL